MEIRIYLNSANNNEIRDNIANSNNDNGIELRSSNENIIANNTAKNNTNTCIYLKNSSDNRIIDSEASNSANYHGISLRSANNNEIRNNTANYNDIMGISLYTSSENNTIENNTAKYNDVNGIYLVDSNDNKILDNDASNSVMFHGIYLNSANNNEIVNNIAKNNNGKGIDLNNSDNNLIYNNYFNNMNNARDSGNNTWNITKTAGTNIIGGPYIGGNYWSDYAGEDTDGDGLGDTQIPYDSSGKIEYGGDWLPLVQASAAQTHYVNPGESIQTAVDNANAGDTIIVRDGTYTENVDVNVHRLTLKSENGYDSTIVQAASTSDHVFDVTADYVTISGFTVKGAISGLKAGIHLDRTIYCNISDNSASGNFYGVCLDHGSTNTLLNNTANSNTYDGIHLFASSYNTLANNTANSNIQDGICVYATPSKNNTITNNTANSNNGCGIHLRFSGKNNTLASNTANSNSNYGIYLESSSNNLIYNNYFDNTINADDDGNNTWDITKTAGTNIIGGAYIGGNYWSDYAGEDTDGDGLGDTQIPYDSSGNIEYGGDWLPLVQASASSVFDTGAGTYPSIQGIHEGKIIPSCDIVVSQMYTYPCAGTGRHTKSIEIYENGDLKASGNWSSYQGDWQNIAITPSVTLKKGREYRYVIETGSYPQIIHVPEYKDAIGGTITCDEFTDANGRTYDNWIPAIRLE